MAVKKKITKGMTQAQKYELCKDEMFELASLKNVGEFSPAFDPFSPKEVAQCLFWVLHEWDMADEGEIEIPKMHVKRMEKFMARWKAHIEPHRKNEIEMYLNFKG